MIGNNRVIALAALALAITGVVFSRRGISSSAAVNLQPDPMPHVEPFASPLHRASSDQAADLDALRASNASMTLALVHAQRKIASLEASLARRERRHRVRMAELKEKLAALTLVNASLSTREQRTTRQVKHLHASVHDLRLEVQEFRVRNKVLELRLRRAKTLSQRLRQQASELDWLVFNATDASLGQQVSATASRGGRPASPTTAVAVADHPAVARVQEQEYAPAPAAAWTLHSQTNCYEGMGGVDFKLPKKDGVRGDSVLTKSTAAACIEVCRSRGSRRRPCTAVTVKVLTRGQARGMLECWLRASVNVSSCQLGARKFHTYSSPGTHTAAQSAAARPQSVPAQSSTEALATRMATLMQTAERELEVVRSATPGTPAATKHAALRDAWERGAAADGSSHCVNSAPPAIEPRSTPKSDAKKRRQTKATHATCRLDARESGAACGRMYFV